MTLPENKGRPISTGRRVNASANPLHCRGNAWPVAFAGVSAGIDRRRSKCRRSQSCRSMVEPCRDAPRSPRDARGLHIEGFLERGRRYGHSSPMRLRPGIRRVHRPGVLCWPRSFKIIALSLRPPRLGSSARSCLPDASRIEVAYCNGAVRKLGWRNRDE